MPCVPSGDAHCSALVTRPPRSCGPSWKILKSHVVSQSQQLEKELVTETLGKESGEKTRCLHLWEIFAQQENKGLILVALPGLPSAKKTESRILTLCGPEGRTGLQRQSSGWALTVPLPAWQRACRKLIIYKRQLPWLGTVCTFSPLFSTFWNVRTRTTFVTKRDANS